MIELGNVDLMINNRVNAQGMRYVHISSDEGKTWKSHPDSTLIDPSCNASILRYTPVGKESTKNRLIFANSKIVKGRKNMTVRISYDEGKTWSVGKTIYPGSAPTQL